MSPIGFIHLASLFTLASAVATAQVASARLATSGDTVQAATTVFWDQPPPGNGVTLEQALTDNSFDIYTVCDVSTGGATWSVQRVTVWFFDLGGWSAFAPPTMGVVNVFPKAGALPVTGADVPPEYTVPITVTQGLFGFTDGWEVSADTSAIAELQGISGDFWIGLTPILTPDDGVEFRMGTASAVGDSSARLDEPDAYSQGTDWVGLATDLSIRLEGDVTVTPDPWTNLGCGLGGLLGQPVLDGIGPLTPGSSGGLVLTNANPSAPAILFVSGPGTPVPFKGGTLCAFPIVSHVPLSTGVFGAVSLPWTSWAAGLSGATLVFQCGIQDPAAPLGVSLSNAMQADVP